MLYSLLYTLAFFALLPYFAYQAIFNRKYLGNLKGRLWLSVIPADSRPAIWLHAVSVGETLAAKPLIAALRQRFPNYRLVITTTTMTGQAVARQQILEADAVCYFPFDWKFTVRRALNAVQPEIVVLMESELWLNFLSECRSRNIPTVVVNGRISDRSFPRSQKFSFFICKLYRVGTHFLMQSQLDAERAVKLGAPAENVSVSGNLKYDIHDSSQSPKLIETAAQLDDRFGLSQSPLIVAGSTSEGEELALLTAFAELRKVEGGESIRLLIAPRHPERFGAVAELIAGSGAKFARRSLANESAKDAEVILLDSIGELAAVYQFASVVFVGGSLVPVGGHNILEAALFAKPIVVGPHMQNFREITAEFLRRDALVQLQTPHADEQVRKLRRTFADLLSNQTRAAQLGTNARQAIEDNRGATARTVAAIAELLPR
ncbi:MAG TPA: 3-deoxy-D-manno-octulosonic acid transferase [Blastocatellia bacterium]|nr:3-deoxy-D-manno-octulosonic acid transferase [Blastocatellia bacterium]